MNNQLKFQVARALSMKQFKSGADRGLTVRHSAQRGLTLVELMVSLAIGLFLVVGLAALFASMSSSRSELDKSSRQIENGRYALQMLSDEIRHAGYYGALANAPAVPASAPVPCSNSLSEVRASIGLPIQGYAGAATSGLTCASNYKPNTAVLVVRRASTSILGFDSGKFNIQVSGCAGDAASFVISDSAADFTLHKNSSPGCVPITAAPAADITPYLTRIFFVSSCSLLTSGGACNDSVPTLKRIDVNPGGTTTTALVEGIENIQFEYGVDESGNGGVPDLYVDEPTLTQWPNVMTVRAHILARNIDQTAGHADTKTYDLGPVSVTPGGAYKRHAYSELVRINNPAGRRE